MCCRAAPPCTTRSGAIVYLDLTAAVTLPAALAESAIAIEGAGSRSSYYTATTGARCHPMGTGRDSCGLCRHLRAGQRM